MKLSELTKGIGVAEGPDKDPEVRALAYDSRNARPGTLFVAVKGSVTDGHRFIGQAIKLGAAAAVVEEYRSEFHIPQVRVEDSRRALAELSCRFYDDPSRRLKLIGITGTNGKTTTSFCLASIFRKAGAVTGIIGTIEYRIDDEVVRAERTTPESLDLQQILAAMVTRGVDVVVMEVSSHALDLHRVDGCRFAARIFTNLSRDHLDYHTDLTAYGRAKKRLFTDPGFGSGPAIVNADDPFGAELIEEIGARSFGFGPADYRVIGARHENSLSVYELEAGGKRISIETSLLGEFNVSNTAAAAAAAWELGVDGEEIMAGIRDVGSVPGRFESIDRGQDFHVLVDYAHTPDGLEKVLKTARKLAGGKRLITLFGCGGDRDPGKRPVMGKIAADLSDLAIVTSDNPRNESPDVIIEDILAGVPTEADAKIRVITERDKAIVAAVEEAGAGDVVVLAGKGHEDYQLVKDKVIPFDDRRLAEKALTALRGSKGRRS